MILFVERICLDLGQFPIAAALIQSRFGRQRYVTGNIRLGPKTRFVPCFLNTQTLHFPFRADSRYRISSPRDVRLLVAELGDPVAGALRNYDAGITRNADRFRVRWIGGALLIFALALAVR